MFAVAGEGADVYVPEGFSAMDRMVVSNRHCIFWLCMPLHGHAGPLTRVNHDLQVSTAGLSVASEAHSSDSAYAPSIRYQQSPRARWAVNVSRLEGTLVAHSSQLGYEPLALCVGGLAT